MRIGLPPKLALLTAGAIAAFTLMLGGCAAMPPSTSATGESQAQVAPPDAAYADAEVAIPALIAAERDGSRRGDIVALSQLWMEAARIVDGRNTAQVDDDYIWDGRAAILDRYRLAVFPHPPPLLEGELHLDITVDGEHAVAVNGVDEWHFAWLDGRWWIRELAYLRP